MIPHLTPEWANLSRLTELYGFVIGFVCGILAGVFITTLVIQFGVKVTLFDVLGIAVILHCVLYVPVALALNYVMTKVEESSLRKRQLEK